jgi:hypothetical protein
MKSIVLIVGLISIPASAAPDGKAIIVEGVADIRGEGVGDARDAAMHSAQRAAVEQIAGVHVQSILSEDALSIVRGDKESFGQEITTRFISQSEGTLRKFRVVKEGRERALYRVSLEVQADDASIAKDVVSLARSMARARYPKLMLAIQEQYTDKNGKTMDVEEPAFLSLLEDALLARGFDLVARGRIEKMRKDERAVFSDLFGPQNAAAKVAMSYQAEYLVNGVARITYASSNDLGLGELHGAVELTLRAINTSTAAVVASFKQEGTTGPEYSEQEVRVKGVQHVGPPVIDNLVTRVLESWKTEDRLGARYMVRVVDLKDYKKQVTPFLRLLQRVPEVSKVKQVSYGGGRLEVELFYPASHDVSLFTQAVMDAAGHTSAFRKLNVALTTGRDVNFTLGKRPE